MLLVEEMIWSLIHKFLSKHKLLVFTLLSIFRYLNVSCSFLRYLNNKIKKIKYILIWVCQGLSAYRLDGVSIGWSLQGLVMASKNEPGSIQISYYRSIIRNLIIKREKIKFFGCLCLIIKVPVALINANRGLKCEEKKKCKKLVKKTWSSHWWQLLSLMNRLNKHRVKNE